MSLLLSAVKFSAFAPSLSPLCVYVCIELHNLAHLQLDTPVHLIYTHKVIRISDVAFVSGATVSSPTPGECVTCRLCKVKVKQMHLVQWIMFHVKHKAPTASPGVISSCFLDTDATYSFSDKKCGSEHTHRVSLFASVCTCVRTQASLYPISLSCSAFLVTAYTCLSRVRRNKFGDMRETKWHRDFPSQRRKNSPGKEEREKLKNETRKK